MQIGETWRANTADWVANRSKAQLQKPGAVQNKRVRMQAASAQAAVMGCKNGS